MVELTNWGARWLSAIVPDKHGEMANVLVSPTDLLSDEFYMGASWAVLPTASEAHASASTGKPTNWKKTTAEHQPWRLLRLRPHAVGLGSFGRRRALHAAFPDEEGGYPGNAHISVEYRWNDDNELSIRYYGTTDRRPT